MSKKIQNQRKLEETFQNDYRNEEMLESGF